MGCTKPASCGRTLRARAVGWIAVVAVFGAVVFSGCSNPNDDFTGRWVSTRVDVTGQPVPYTGVIEGVPVLAIGHYGPEVAGITYYGVAGGSQLQELCPCAFVDHLRANTIDGALEFETQCSTASDAAYWKLTLRRDALDGETYLEGTVGRADGVGGSQQVSFRRESNEVVEADRQCPP